MGRDDKRNNGIGIFIPLSADEKELVEHAIKEQTPGTPSGKFARTALFYYLHMIEKHGLNRMLSEILGA